MNSHGCFAKTDGISGFQGPTPWAGGKIGTVGMV